MPTGFTFLLIDPPDTPNIGRQKINYNFSMIAFSGITGISASIFTNPNPTTQQVGGIPAGSTFPTDYYLQDMMDLLLYPAITPNFTSLDITGEAIDREIGLAVTATPTFTWNIANAADLQPNTISISNTTSSTLLATGLANDGTETVFAGAVNNSSPAFNVWTIVAYDVDGAPFSRTFSIEWRYRIFYGSSTNLTLNAAEIVALSGNELRNDVVGTYGFDGSDYGYVCVPLAFSTPSGFQDSSSLLPIEMSGPTEGYSSFDGSFYYSPVVVTRNSVPITYRVYRTMNTTTSSGVRVSATGGTATTLQSVINAGNIAVGDAAVYGNFSANTFYGNGGFLTGIPTITGGTYSAGTATFGNSTGGTFDVSGFYTGSSQLDIYTTGGTYTNGTATFGNSTGGTFAVDGFLTANDFQIIIVTGDTLNSTIRADLGNSAAYGSTVFGEFNTATAQYATIGGGFLNEVHADHATMGGGFVNGIYGIYGTVAGGVGNYARGAQSSVGGGAGNEAEGESSSVFGGVNNRTYSDFAFIGGGQYNRIDLYSNGSAILGGSGNTIYSANTFILGSDIIAYSANTTFVNYLNLHNLLEQDDALTQVLVRSPTGRVKYRSATTFGGSPTHVQNGTNTTTGGTASAPTVNVVPDPTFNSVYAVTLSGSSIFSGDTNLSDIISNSAVLPTALDGEMLYNSGGTWVHRDMSIRASDTASDWILVGGDNSEAIDSSLVGVFAGQSNTITTSSGSVILGNNEGGMTKANWSAIVAGESSSISDSESTGIFAAGGSNIDNSTNSVIIGGFSHTISSTNSYNAIAGGNTNFLFGAVSSIMGGGEANFLIDTTYAAMLGGYANIIAGPNTLYSAVIGGHFNTIGDQSGDPSNDSIIAGGTAGLIATSTASTIVGGGQNTIKTSLNSAIIGGTGNTLIGRTGSVIIAANGITGTSNNTLYTNNISASAITATTITANIFYSAGTDLSQYFTGGASTYVQDGTNTTTGGTITRPTVNVVPNPTFTSVSAVTMSATTIFLGGTNLLSYVSGGTTSLSGVYTYTSTSLSPALIDARAEMILSAGTFITLLVPTNATAAFPIGTQIMVKQGGVGQVRVSGVTGVVLNSYGNAYNTVGTHSTCYLTKENTNEWTIDGNLTTLSY